MFKVAIRNVMRQRVRTAMTLAAIVSGVAALMVGGGWVDDIFLQLGEALIHSQSGHLQVYQRGYYEAGSRSPEKYLISSPERIKSQISKAADVKDVMARLYFSGLLSTGRSDIPITGEGVEPNKEAELGSSAVMIQGRRLTDKDPFGIELGKGVAKALKLSPGDHVTLLANTIGGALNTADLSVVGVFQTFSNDYDARAVKIPLAAAQELLGTNGVNAIVISLNETKSTLRVAAWLHHKLGPENMEIKTWVELNDFYEKTVELYRRQFGFLQFIILFMVLLSVANSINTTVFERVGEFGTMMALGDRSNQIFRLVVLEGALLGVLGSSVGVALGIGLAVAISEVGIPMPPPPNADIGYTARIQVTYIGLLTSFLIGSTATILASILPARKVARIPVPEALRQNV